MRFIACLKLVICVCVALRLRVQCESTLRIRVTLHINIHEDYYCYFSVLHEAKLHVKHNGIPAIQHSNRANIIIMMYLGSNSPFTCRSAQFLLKIISQVPVPGCVLLENSICYSDFTVA